MLYGATRRSAGAAVVGDPRVRRDARASEDREPRAAERVEHVADVLDRPFGFDGGGRLWYHSALFMADLETEIKELIIEALMLDDVKVESIDSEAPLFVEGLGLDSIDALELAMAVDKRFGVRIRADDEQNRQIFASVKSLAAYVAQHKTT